MDKDYFLNDYFRDLGYKVKHYSDDKYKIDDFKEIYKLLSDKTYKDTYESDEDRKARLLREKAIKRNDKIDKLLNDEHGRL